LPPSGGFAFDEDGVDGRIAPAFEPEESELIAAWSTTMRERGVYSEMNRNHARLTEALHVLSGSDDEPLWLVHKTPDGTTAVRLWPGIAEIVPMVEDALARITKEIDRRTIAPQS
jgi:hypothetical protein